MKMESAIANTQRNLRAMQQCCWQHVAQLLAVAIKRNDFIMLQALELVRVYNKCGQTVACGQLLPIFVFALPKHKLEEEEEKEAAAATVERVHFGSR